MKQIQLPNTGKTTSQLGFGCSGLMTATGRRESLGLLEQAFEAGIRHFDVAPMYGYGAAEGCLGEFLARHPGEVSVTTKYGIPPPSNPGLVQAARRVVGPVLNLSPGIKRRLAGAAGAVTAPVPVGQFRVAEARASLDRSLAALRTERLDFWLLHEAEAQHLGDPGLLAVLQEAVSAGKVGAFGVGSSADKIAALVTHRAEYCPVLQFEWSVLDPPLERMAAFTMHHRALTANFADLSAALARQPSVRQRWSSEIGADLAQPGMLAALMLKAALVLNPDSIILVSSRNPAHIRENVRVAGDGALVEPARRLFYRVQLEGATVLVRG